ncbi:MAG: crossover junction endodeoxyribonuclease RuvC [Acidimicrobiia bacterium]
MFVLGIDPGLTRTGYGVVESSGGKVRALAAGVIVTNPDIEDAMRLLELRDDLDSVLDEHPIDTAAIEQVFVNRNRGTAIAVARASGVVMATIASRGIGVTEYSPSSMKMAITGSGSATKDQIAAVLDLRLGIGTLRGPVDATDALGVALCHIQHAGLLARLATR